MIPSISDVVVFDWLTLTLSTHMSSAENRPKFYNFFPKISEIQTVIAICGFSIKMH